MSSPRKFSLPIILTTIFLDMLGIGILIPVIPLLLADPTSAYYLLPAGWSAQSGYILLGFLTACYPLAQFLAAPILGQLSDRYGRKNVLVISLLGTASSYILFAVGILVQSIPLLFLSRIFDGLTGGNIAVAQASIADITEPKDRAKTFGLMGAIFGLGFIMGPYLGGKLSDPQFISWFSAATPFWFAAILSLLNVVSVIFFFNETHLHLNGKLKIYWNKSIHHIIKAFGMVQLRVLFVTNFLFQAGFSFFTTFFSVFLIKKFAYDQGDIGNFFAYVGIWIMITQALITRFAVKYLSERTILKGSIILCGLSILLYFLPTASWQLLLIVPLFAIFNGLTNANLTSIISRSVDGKVQGEILGINSSVQALATSIPPIISGFLAAQFSPYLPIIVSGTIVVMAGIVF